MKNSHRCDICNINFHRVSYAKDIGSEKHIKNEKKNIKEWLFQEPIGNRIKKIYNPKTLEQIARKR